MRVKILKPLSKGKGGASTDFFKVGEIINFAKDIPWNEKINVKAQAYDLSELGYIEILADVPDLPPEPVAQVPKMQVKKPNGKK